MKAEEMNETTRTDIKAALIALVERGQAQEEEFRASLSAQEREQVGTQEQWALKEVIAHLGFWKRKQSERLEAAARGEEPPSGSDFQQVNDESWPELKALTWEQAVARSDQATRDLIATLERLPDELFSGVADPSSQASLFVGTTLGNAPGHVAEHVANYYLDHGDEQRAADIMRATVAEVVSANLGGALEASARYNLACFYAKHGKPSDTLDELRQAFALRPDLMPWAREDHDLDSLRADPEFQALLPAEG
jgi:hypothetical protein